MKTQWDYTDLAEAYLERPEYAPEVLERLFAIADLKQGNEVCDIGAGVAHLTIPLVQRGFQVTAIEPNDAMRDRGRQRTASLADVAWFEATAEQTGQSDQRFDFVTFGSSFNVTDRQAALRETHRILKPCRWFACLWNHRILDDPIQKEIESIIIRHIPTYDYGSRREDQTRVILDSGLFTSVQQVSGHINHRRTTDQIVQAWRSHGTLHRQAGEAFAIIIEQIEEYLQGLHTEELVIPYTTNAWVARRKD